ncbi:molybdenum cofactor guanylyltransferase [Paenibacillus sp. JX-17]|uniref:Probable molybdenum cofactor guanylyltransferase n=1 Tax=Paenibacillus lacisoli TaxID=3064525 RepID=A0ABT9CB42_9BACL|nr:molybdenum cofactor guanylyltransferase [Paenibacillus sp. JX-17]MDO7906483.1 molybdenum cofactor guanylyltransferase [Paenibacillus sp. JX-17]
MKITGAILAGGKSSRMGKDKGLLPLEGGTVIDHLLQQMEPAVKERLISTNEPQAYAFTGMPLITDNTPGLGPLSGIQAILQHCAAADDCWCLVTACDMPLADTGLYRALAACAEEAGRQGMNAVIPVIQGRIQPLPGIYHPSAALTLNRPIQEGRLKLMDWLGELQVLYVDDETLRSYGVHHPERLFFNMNTPAGYAYVLRELQE